MQNVYEHIISLHFLSHVCWFSPTSFAPLHAAMLQRTSVTHWNLGAKGSNPPTEMPPQHGVGSLVWLNLAWILPKSPSIWGGCLESWIQCCYIIVSSLPGLVNVYITNWKDPPCYQWVNPLFRLGPFEK